MPKFSSEQITTLDELNRLYRNYDFTFVEGTKPVLGMKRDSRKNEFPIFSESMTLNISTNMRLKLGLVNHYCYSDNFNANRAIYPIVMSTNRVKQVHRVDFDIIERLEDLDGMYDGSSDVVVLGNTLYTDKPGTWIGKGGANVKMLSRALGCRVNIASKKELS